VVVVVANMVAVAMVASTTQLVKSAFYQTYTRGGSSGGFDGCVGCCGGGHSGLGACVDGNGWGSGSGGGGCCRGSCVVVAAVAVVALMVG